MYNKITTDFLLKIYSIMSYKNKLDQERSNKEEKVLWVTYIQGIHYTGERRTWEIKLVILRKPRDYQHKVIAATRPVRQRKKTLLYKPGFKIPQKKLEQWQASLVGPGAREEEL